MLTKNKWQRRKHDPEYQILKRFYKHRIYKLTWNDICAALPTMHVFQLIDSLSWLIDNDLIDADDTYYWLTPFGMKKFIDYDC